MTEFHHTLAFLWFFIIGFGILMYVILDGFDLGIGIMSLFIHDERQRDIMISTIMPVWDGNETWLVFGGAALYGAFPLAFSTILPALYIPLLIMVASLLFRGVAFEFRMKAEKSKRLWELAFSIGSIVVVLIQGVMLGAFVHGFPARTVAQPVPDIQWLTPFSMFCGIALVFGYVLLASNWLVAKTTGELQKTSFRTSRSCLVLVAIFGVLVSIWSPFIDPHIWKVWFNPETMWYLAVLPVVTILFFVLHWVALNKRKEFLPFWLAIGIFLLCYAGFGISTWPYIVPRSITYLQAAAPSNSLLFMLVGACIMLPVLLYYTYHSYRIFRGKVEEPIEY